MRGQRNERFVWRWDRTKGWDELLPSRVIGGCWSDDRLVGKNVAVSEWAGFAVKPPIVDPARIALNGWRQGGHLAPRVASGEPRIAALIADPVMWGIAGGFREAAIRLLGIPREAAADIRALDDATLQPLDSFIRSNRDRRWKVVQCRFWVHGVQTCATIFGKPSSSQWKAQPKGFSVRPY